MDQSCRANPASDPFDRWTPRLITVLAVAMILARLSLVFRRLYDPDELQHLHAGYCVWHGQVPYRDFFEQHQPVLWYLSLPLFAIWGGSLKVLFAGRLLIWLSGSITFWLTWLVGNRLFGRFAAAIALLLLAIHPPYQEKNVEWRPDNLAVPFVLMAILNLDRAIGSNRLRHAALSGAAFASAFFCTQKVVYTVVGVLAAFLLCPRDSRSAARSGRVAMMLFALGGGVTCVTSVVMAYFFARGAIDPFVQLTLIGPLTWQTREPIGLYVVNQLASGAVLWSAAVSGFILVLGEVFRRQAGAAGAALIAGGALTHTLGLLHVPAAFHQYYLPLSPLLAILAGNALAVLANWRQSLVAPAVRLLAVLAGVAVAGESLNLRRLVTLLPPVWVPLIGSLLVAAGILCLIKWRRAGVVTTLVAAALGACSYHLIQFQWTHEHQTRRIEQLMQATSDDDAFFDGFTGYGALRPHAFYAFWINHHSWPMIPAADRLGGVLHALADPHTRVVLFDQNLRRFLPGDALQQIDRDFAPDARYSDLPTLVVYARRDRPLPGIEQDVR